MKKTSLILASIALCGMIGFGFIGCSKSDNKADTTANAQDGQQKAKSSLTIDSITVYGDEITNAAYKKNDVTLVNIMATWCGPCVGEVPELQEIDAEDNGIGVIGMVVDTYDESTGKPVDEAMKEAQNIAEKTGAKYPFVVPTQAFLEVTLKKVAALLPMSYIVDQDGNVLKGPIAGARSKEEWLDLINSVEAGL